MQMILFSSVKNTPLEPMWKEVQQLIWKNYEIKVIPDMRRLITLKVQSAILIPYTFCHIQRIAPEGPLAVRSLFALEKLCYSNTILAL